MKKKGFKEARVTRMRLDNLGTSTTLESNKSQRCKHSILSEGEVS